MKLLIISHTPYYRRGAEVVGWGPTVREIDNLAEEFERIVHVAPLHTEPAPASCLPHQSDRVVLRPVPAAGGRGLIAKLNALRCVPIYARAILRELPAADFVHVRCPANISTVAIVLLSLVRRPRIRWIKYAGNWRPEGREALSYTFQRWWLARDLPRSAVTVNGDWPDQPRHIRSFFNPCLTEEEAADAQRAATAKRLSSPIRLLFVGRLEAEKGAGRALEILKGVTMKGHAATLDLVGDGPLRRQIEEQARRLEVDQLANFHGWLPRTQLGPLYARSHLLLLPTSCSEGWPKVLSEAMAHGVVPVSGNVSSIPQNLRRFGSGKAIPPGDLDEFVEAIIFYVQHPEIWREESQAGTSAAALFTYNHFRAAVRKLIAEQAA